MILYHGSSVIVERPKIVHSLRTLDFGPGFYTTTNKAQAVDFAGKVMIRAKGGAQFVSVYEFDPERAKKELDILQFDKPDGNWLDFVFQNRRGIYEGKRYDAVTGPVANDDVYTTLQLFERGILTREQTMDALKIKNLYMQIVFSAEKSVALLVFKHAFDPREANSHE
jgi:hypothetical protein